ncbi:crossover junction endodeoxyribonuclease RuvC [Azospirillum brasilense]|nr:crossover junction endodeoxyribonuclease RuvC [Azospirillum brasilense]NUB33550.1 crossover junction endodeoxyribonuclease RuvC [Azospirillum brasilense]
MLGQAGRSGAAQQPPVRLLGLDPGLRHTGWGVIDVSGNRLTHVADGAVHSEDGRPLAERLCQLHGALTEVLERYRPDEAAVEETFVNSNAVSTLKLGQARAVALLVPALAGLSVAEYANNMVKKAVVGQGRADKTQVQAMVRLLLPGCAITTPDAADALAVAICHAHHRQSLLSWTPASSLSPPGRGQGEGAQLLARGKMGGVPPSPRPSPQGGEGEWEVLAQKKASEVQTVRARQLRRDSTDVEKLLWQRLRNAQMGAKFRRQEPILGFTVDFVAHDHRLVIELDGGQHADRVEQDQRRTRMLEQAGFRVLRFWNNELNENLDGVLETIKARLDETTILRRQPSGRESLP